jgi:hypothetical protein
MGGDMRVRNKKTGETAEIILKLNESLHDAIRRTIEEAGWEETREPLIKDEKIRKAVRAWAEANGFGTTDPLRYTLTEESEVVSFDNGTNLIKIMFCGFPDGIKGLNHLEWNTIAELCGEEE